MKRIKIGLFIDTYFPMIDGVTMVVDNYAKRLTKYADVVVFSPKMFGKPFDDAKLPYKVVRCKSLAVPFIDYSLPVPKLDRQFIKSLKEENLDLIHIHSPATIGKLGIEYARKRNIPVVATMHSQYKMDIKRAVKLEGLANFINHQLIKKTFDKCDECWAVNNEIARIFFEEYKCKQKPKTMNNATEMIPVKDPKKAKKIVYSKHNIKENERVLLFVGRLNALKNIFLIADSLKILKEKSSEIKFKMIFAGTGQDEGKLKKRIKDNNLESEIILAGKISNREELAQYYASADLFLFPSLYDSSSIVQIEAASQKTPGLFIEGAATASTIQNEQNGFLSKNNSQEYAYKIAKILKDKELLEKVSQNCYNELYKNWDDCVEEVYSKYKELIDYKR